MSHLPIVSKRASQQHFQSRQYSEKPSLRGENYEFQTKLSISILIVESLSRGMMGGEFYTLRLTT